MSRGRTSSALSLSARREKAAELFARGYTITDVAREIQVSPDTALRYKKLYKERVKAEADGNPSLLKDVLTNTIGALTEIDQIRQEAWRRYEQATNDAQRVSYLNTALKAGTERNKVLQLFGVKAEYMSQVALVQRQQEALINFLGTVQLCEQDRDRIVDFLASQMSDDLLALPTADETS